MEIFKPYFVLEILMIYVQSNPDVKSHGNQRRNHIILDSSIDHGQVYSGYVPNGEMWIVLQLFLFNSSHVHEFVNDVSQFLTGGVLVQKRSVSSCSRDFEVDIYSKDFALHLETPSSGHSIILTPDAPFSVEDRVFVGGSSDSFVKRESDVQGLEVCGWNELFHSQFTTNFFV